MGESVTTECPADFDLDEPLKIAVNSAYLRWCVEGLVPKNSTSSDVELGLTPDNANAPIRLTRPGDDTCRDVRVVMPMRI